MGSKFFEELSRCLGKEQIESLSKEDRRLEIVSDRCRIPAHEPLASLESRLARPIFLRCQRGFLVNLCHVRRLDTLGFHMSDGAVVPLSRNSRAGAAERYRQLCLLRHGETGEIRNA